MLVGQKKIKLKKVIINKKAISKKLLDNNKKNAYSLSEKV